MDTSRQLSDFTRNDTWPGATFTVVWGDDPTRPSPITSARMFFRRRSNCELGDTLSTADNTITVLDATNYEIRVGKKKLALDAGNWVWDLEVETLENDVYTIAFGTMFVRADVTFDD